MATFREPSTERRIEWTPRQREVLALIAKGRTNPEIAEALGVSLAGAKWHVSEVMTTLGVDSRDEAAEYWRAENRLPRRFSNSVRALCGAGMLKTAAVAGAAAAVGGVVLLTVPLIGRDAPRTRPECAPWQAVVSAGTTMGDKSSIASVGANSHASGGPSCTLTDELTLTFADMAGNELPIQGNGIKIAVKNAFHWDRVTLSPSGEPIAFTPVADPPDAAQRESVMSKGLVFVNEGGQTESAVWTNWCGSYVGPVAVHVTAGRYSVPEPTKYLSNPPRCDDPATPSTVVVHAR
jgi:DNA-binding CsgD family transcriptional regulator